MEKEKIQSTINSLSAGGGTQGSAGLLLAYEQAEKFKVSGNNRIILCTDGDFNVGISDRNVPLQLNIAANSASEVRNATFALLFLLLLKKYPLSTAIVVMKAADFAFNTIYCKVNIIFEIICICITFFFFV